MNYFEKIAFYVFFCENKNFQKERLKIGAKKFFLLYFEIFRDCREKNFVCKNLLSGVELTAFLVENEKNKDTITYFSRKIAIFMYFH